MLVQAFMSAGAAIVLALLWNLGRCWRGIVNDANIISIDPALQSKLEILYAYPGFWALFWYRLSHALLQQNIPGVSSSIPRLAMSVVRYATAIDIHPGASISDGGILIDHGAGLVIGETAVVGSGVTLYHGVTLGNSGKKVPPGEKRHPTIGDRVVVGAGAKILGNIVLGDDVLVGANSVVTKPVPTNHTAVGAPARVLCHGAATGRDVAGAAICELHRRLEKVERGGSSVAPVSPEPTSVVAVLVDGGDDNKEAGGAAGLLAEGGKVEQQQQQQSQRDKLPVVVASSAPQSLSPSSEGGIRDILYSQRILESSAAV